MAPDDDGGGGDHGPPPVGDEGADEDQELPDEPVEAGQPDRGHDHGQEDGGQDGRRLLQAAEVADRRVPRRSQMTPTRKKMAPVVSPWLTISSTPPVTPWALKAKNPSTMKATSTMEA